MSSYRKIGVDVRLGFLTRYEVFQAAEAKRISDEDYSLDTCIIGYDLRHVIDEAERERSTMDFHDDLEGMYDVFIDLLDGPFDTAKRINERLNAFNSSNSLTRCRKRDV